METVRGTEKKAVPFARTNNARKTYSLTPPNHRTMNQELKELINRIGIAEAEKAIAELKNKKWDRERCSVEFCKLIEGMELRTHPDRPNVNLWDGLIDGQRVTLFEQDLKAGIVWCHRKYVWMVLKENYSSSSAEVQAMLKRLLEEHLNWRVETTWSAMRSTASELEERLKWRVETTDRA